LAGTTLAISQQQQQQQRRVVNDFEHEHPGTRHPASGIWYVPEFI
jgi:hypothetical protein